MSDLQRLRALSRAMSWILRHEAERLALPLDPEGYVELPVLLAALAEHGTTCSAEDLHAVVAGVDPHKQRFSIVDGWIRANYGHSLAARIGHDAAAPPPVLYHGSSERSREAIAATGLRPMQRQYVHLATDPALAASVGRRHGAALVYRVDAATAHRDGIAFHRANPAFWLALAIPAAYLAPM